MEFNFEEFKAKAIEKIKAFYFFFEDKWYQGLDKLDKQVPVYKVIDPVDQVIPSYILLLLLMLFVLILVGYIMNFNNTYDINIVTLDSATQSEIGGVNIFGSVNQADFDEYTDATGVLEFPVTGPPMNFFEVFFRLFIPQEDDFEFIVSTRKEGYANLDDEEFILTTYELEGELYLSPIVDGGGTGPGSVSLTLRNSETRDPIRDSTAYIKFKCDNNPAFATRTIRDDDDGALDGVFALIAEDCEFRVTEIGADGYETIRNSFPVTRDREITLVPLENNTVGIARLLAVELGATPQKSIPNISLKLNRDNNGTMSVVDQGITNNSGTLVLNDLAPGTYVITGISIDENEPYFPVTPANDVTIDITAGQTTEKIVYLTFMDSNEMRRIYVKTIDANSGDAISGTEIVAYWLRQDNNKTVADVEAGNSPVATDFNGLAEITGFASTHADQLVAVARKTGYLYTVFEPELFRTTDGPQIVELGVATPQNSGQAQVNVVEASTASSSLPLPLRGATTYIFARWAQFGIDRLRIDTGITNAIGESLFKDLNPGTYSASAEYNGASSGISGTKALDVNQLIVFDLNIDTSISYLRIKLFDKETNSQINLSGARVKIYTLQNSASYIGDLVETLSQVNTAFTSTTYFAEERLMLEATAPGYVTGRIITRTDFVNGPNDFNIYLYDASNLTGNVNTFFDGIYTDSSIIETGAKSNLTTWASGQTYYAKFDVLIHKQDFNYQELFSTALFESSSDFVNVTGVPIADIELFHKESDVFTTSTIDSVNDNLGASESPYSDSYYYPNVVTHKTVGKKGIQASTKWDEDQQSDGELWDGAYYMVVSFELDSFADDDKLDIYYRAKEKHSSGESETALKHEEFFMGEAQCDEICFRINLNGTNVDYSGQTSSPYSNDDEYELNYESGNEISVEVFNPENSSLSGVLKLYSFDSTIEAFAFAAGGDLYFEASSQNGGVQVTSGVTLQMGARSWSDASDESVFPAKRWINNYIVADFTPTSGGNHFTAFVGTYVPGKIMKLKNREFIAGLLDQNYGDYVVSNYNVGNVDTIDLTSVYVMVDKNCNNSCNNVRNGQMDDDWEDNGSGPATFDFTDSSILTSYFMKNIPGVFNINKDCLRVYATANNYDDLCEEVYATTGGTVDPNLACIDVFGEDDLTDVILEWGHTTDVEVTNNCDEDVSFYFESGLACNECGKTNIFNLSAGDSKLITITGENVTYSPSTQFSDVLGVFPISIKAKLSSASRYKDYAVADEMLIHLENEDDCFAISKDIFNFYEDGDVLPFNFDSKCQYVEFEDYYVPKAILESFGANLNNPSEIDFSSVSFDWQLVASKTDYNVTYVDTPITSRGNVYSAELSDYNLFTGDYNTITFDMSGERGTINNLFFKWVDYIEGGEETYLTEDYGVKINEIRINYKDGTTVTKTGDSLGANFDLNPPVTCACGDPLVPVHSTGGNPTGCPNDPTCVVGWDDSDIYDNPTSNYYHGITYIDIPEGEVDTVEFDIDGPPDPSKASVIVKPMINYTVQTPVVSEPTDSDDVVEFNLGDFTIYPFEGVTFILRNISYGATDVGNTLPEKYCVENVQGDAWLKEENGKGETIYWIENSTKTRDEAIAVCNGTSKHGDNIFGVKGTLVSLSGDNAVPSDIKTEMQNYISAYGNIIGVWGTGNDVLTANEVLTQTNGDNVTDYLPACQYNLDSVTVVKDSYCGTTNDAAIKVVCETTEATNPVCSVVETSNSSIFLEVGYLGSRNPKLRVEPVPSTIQSDEPNTLEDGTVMIWIEGRYLKARYLGEDIDAFNDGTIELELKNDFVTGTQYGIINIKDYVHKGRLQNAG